MAPWRELGQAVEASLHSAKADAPLDLASVFNAMDRAPVRFVPQTALPEGAAYESHIAQHGQVPTRDNLHDGFNALCWIRFPRTKRALNRLQAQAIEASGGIQATRGPLRDAITLLDENALLLQAPEALWKALMARDWQRLFLTLRPLWADARVVTLGHALTEKLVTPYKSITAHVLCLPIPLHLPPDPGCGVHPWDEWLAPHLDPAWLAQKPFTPLPVMGIPGWCEDNHHPAFYADTGVFRPPRLALHERA